MLPYVCVTFLILGSFLAAAVPDEKTDIHEFMSDIMNKCTEEFGVSPDIFEEARKNKKFGDVDPCLVACIHKSIKLIDDNGMFDPKEADAFTDRFFKNSDEVDKYKKATKTCTSVNDEKVTDGNKGCERAMLLVKCLKGSSYV